MSKQESLTKQVPKSTRPDALRKRSELIKAANALFVELGFERASIEELVNRTGASKATIYSHFGSKEGLFIAVNESLMDRHLWPLEHENMTEQPLHQQLAIVAEQTMCVLLTEDGLGLARTTFMQAKQFPDIAEAMYRHGLQRATNELAKLLAAHTRQPKKKAEYFWAMLMHQLALEGYLGLNKPMSIRQRKSHARRVIDDFLGAFISD